jgi:hypothetical protein
LNTKKNAIKLVNPREKLMSPSTAGLWLVGFLIYHGLSRFNPIIKLKNIWTYDDLSYQVFFFFALFCLFLHYNEFIWVLNALIIFFTWGGLIRIWPHHKLRNICTLKLNHHLSKNKKENEKMGWENICNHINKELISRIIKKYSKRTAIH